MAELTDDDILKGLYKKANAEEKIISESKKRLQNIHKAIEAFGGNLNYLTNSASLHLTNHIDLHEVDSVDEGVDWEDLTWREKAEFAILNLGKPATISEIIDYVSESESLDRETLRKRLTNALRQNENKYFKFKQLSGRKRVYSLIKKTAE
ncbi:MAG: hypothetical protein JNL49_01865 [Bacteroidia bacterium]|nr:hypothetical protein [Bacteroidia bacterium]